VPKWLLFVKSSGKICVTAKDITGGYVNTRVNTKGKDEGKQRGKANGSL